MAINFGSGDLGDVSLTEDTTMTTIESYQNLNIPFGVDLTVPNGAVLQVSDTLTLDGTITVEPRHGSRGGYGGDAGGSFFILAETVTGSGTINANAVDGQDRSNTNYNNNNDTGSSGLPPVIAGAKTNVITTGSGGGSGTSGGVASDTAVTRDLLSIWLDEWMVPSAKISGLPMAKLLSGGGSDSSQGRRNNNGGYGGGGGAGGSFGGRGGNGGNGQGNTNSANKGRSGGGGGGAGGLIVIVSKNLSIDITVQTKGASGGNGSNGTPASGTGGGGGGGIVIAVTPNAQKPTYVVDGGLPGDTGHGIGNGGQDGVFTHIPLSMIE
jgi:hypothetical protein